MTDPKQDVRQQFEAWAKSKDLDLTPSHGGYLWPSVQYSYSAYQAALQSPAVRELVEAASDALNALDEVGKAERWPLRAALRTLGAGHVE